MSSLSKPGTMAVEDPFVSPSSADAQRQRYSAFDGHQFSLYSNGSPSQVRRALEAHLSETERRLKEASSVGTVLLKQRQDIHDRLKDIENNPTSDDIGPELRQKLSELEREVSQVSKETARIFIPKSRVPSGESVDGGESAVFSSQAQHSPSKIHAPSRKLRNQAPARTNDVKLATELSDSLLNQLRDLQAAYAEKDDAWKEAMSRKGEIEDELETMRQRLRTLDESEQSVKDENWNLETQLHELTAAHKESTEREQKLSQTLLASKAETAALEREFEELKQTHSKLAEDHIMSRKQTDSEVSTLRRNAAASEAELTGLQKKVEDLTTQNKELAKAFAARHREAELAIAHDFSGISGDEIDDQITPDPSPPPSPSKATPRHGALESETLKSSLLHAQRQIQHLKNNIHREKTEKFELKRLLQESRDELESRRKGGDAGGKKKNMKQSDMAKKQTRPDRLGAAREAREEIINDDPEWEDHDLLDTPSKSTTVFGKSVQSGRTSATTDHSTDAYVTATEGSDAFETANENDASTETDAFQTTVETLDGDSEGDLTETEKLTPRTSDFPKKPSPNTNRYSMQSTASTSEDDVDYGPATTPVQTSHPKFKLRIGRGGSRKTTPRNTSDVTTNDSPATVLARDSPVSTASASGTPQGRSLFAELGDFSDGETEQNVTPQSAGIRSVADTPEMSRKTPLQSRLRAAQSFDDKPEMVDSTTMTQTPDPVRASIPELIGAGATGAAAAAVIEHHHAHENKPEIKLVQSIIVSQHTEPYEPPVIISQPPALNSSAIVSQDSQPSGLQKSVPPTARSLNISEVHSQHTPPEEKPKPVFSVLGNSAIVSQTTEPLLVLDDSVFTMKSAPLTNSKTFSQETTPYEPAEAPDVLTVEQQKEKNAESRPTSKSGTPSSKAGFGLRSMFKRGKQENPEPIVVAEDSTSDSNIHNKDAVVSGQHDSRVPFQAVDGNAQTIKSASNKPVQKQTMDASTTPEFPMLSESTQTMLSANDIDKLFKASASKESPSSPTRGGVLFGSTSPRKGRDTIRRPGSQGSNRSTTSPPPPLPADSKQVIAAAANRSSIQSNTGPTSALTAPQPAGTNSMPPPIMPASAYNRGNTNRRPRTPVGSIPSPGKARPGAGLPRSGVSSPATRRSSVSSFASELDQRFNIARPPYDHQPGTDPRMILALTQTMIGEFLWKYTRKAGREEFSSMRHQRYFWIHPYTRTLYWSERDPSRANRSEVKAKSIGIESVQVVTDNNPNPPGLYHKSIIVQTTGRPLKFTAPTSQRHETWFNALSYLLQRTDEEEGANAEDTAEFNPQFRSNSRATGRSGRASVSSYASRTTSRAHSPSRQYPTLRPGNRGNIVSSSSQVRSQSAQPHEMSSVSSRLSAVFRTPQTIRGSIVSRYSRQSEHSNIENEDPAATGAERKNSAENMRRAMVASERQAHLMENVRACCDGKSPVFCSLFYLSY
jgi:meiotic cell cortex pleckstrin-like protein